MTPQTDTQNIYDFTMETLEGETRSLADFKGKVILCVNVASKCGLTPQYKDLQALYEAHADEGLVILGFPANNFMGQEPGSNEEIATFCERNYGVTFPMFAKISVKGKDPHPLYQYLTEATGTRPGWNFHKYLINRDGSEVISFDPRTRVTEESFQQALKARL